MKRIITIVFLCGTLNLAAMNFNELITFAYLSLATNAVQSVVGSQDSVKNKHVENDSKVQSQRRSKEFFATKQQSQTQKFQGKKTFRKQGNNFRK